jgi:RHS repeat-associated protein
LSVYFDNLKVKHHKGALLEETHYYPFGLTMAGISSKASGKLENRRGYNGNEIQNKEFSDGSGLDVYDFNARTYDQQLGRFIQIDPLADFEGQESLSPYHFSYNNPVTFSDPDGKCPCLLPVIIYKAVEVAVVATVAYLAAKEAAPVITDAIMKTEAPTLPNLNAPTADANAFIPLSAQMAKAKVEKSTNEKPAPTFDGQQDTESATPREAFRKAKEQNAIPRSQQPDRTIKPNTPEGDDRGLDSRNVKQYEFDKNSKGQKVVIRQDKEAIYPTGPPQPPHFNAGQNPQTPKDASQHHNVITPFSYFINRIRH